MASPFFLVWTLSALINKERLRLFFLAFIIQQKPRGLESYLSFFHLSKRHSEPRERKIPHPHQTGTISGSNITPTLSSQIPVACRIQDEWVIQYDSSSSSHLFHLFFQWRIFWTFGGREQTIIKEHWFSLFFWVATRSVNRCLFCTRANLSTLDDSSFSTRRSIYSRLQWTRL